MCYSALVKQDYDYLARQYGAAVVRRQVDAYDAASARNHKRFPPREDRIYPGYYAPVVATHKGARVAQLMRYGAYPPSFVGKDSAYTTFNARLDNLDSKFWGEAFLKHHGFVVLSAFYEWVQVRDLLAAGVVGLDQVQAEFARQQEERKQKLTAAGKAFKPTPTEKLDPRARKIVIEFAPQDGQDLLAPVICSRTTLDDGTEDFGFAIITNDPPLEVSRAGHDRCPVVLSEAAASEWLLAASYTAEEARQLLLAEQRVTFRHKLAEAA